MSSTEIREVESGRPRPLWLTVPLYFLGVAVIVVDVWGVVFWARVGGRFGITAVVLGILVALTLVVVIATDLRRQLEQ